MCVCKESKLRGQRSTDILFNLVTLYDQLFMRMHSSFPVMTEWVIYHDQTVKLLCVRRTIITRIVESSM